MKKRAGQDHEVIVRRRVRKGHEQAHSGAWKVAFADFTMAMMALFMVLWIVQPRNDLKNPADGDLHSNPLVDGGAGIFDGSSRTPLDLDGVPVQVSSRTDATSEADRPQDDTAKAGEGALDERRHYATTADMRELAELVKTLALQLDAEANLEVDVVPQGLRILLKDDQQRFMFQRGSAMLNPHFRGLLAGLARALGKVDNKLIISGHTDATQYRQKAGYNNWNLSGDRALRARNVLVEEGLPATGVLQVTAHADVMPLRPDEPESGSNRRIEILLLTNQAEALYRELFGDGHIQARVSEQGVRLVNPSPAEADKAAL
jgi:chemotaxis protein MotB